MLIILKIPSVFVRKALFSAFRIFSQIIPGCHTIKILKRFVEIAMVAIANQRSDFLYGKGGVPKQDDHSFHSFFQQDLGEGFAGLFMEQRGNISGMIGKGLPRPDAA